MPTTADLISAALAEITVARAAQANDITDATPRLAPVLADLAARRVIPAITDTVPNNLFPDLVRVFGEHVAPQFAGRPTNLEAVAIAEARLRELSRLDRTASTPLVRKVLEQLEIFGGGKNVLDATAVSERVGVILAELSGRGVINFAEAEDDLDGREAEIPELVRYMAAALSEPQRYDVMQFAERRLRVLNRADFVYRPIRASYF